MQFAGTHLLTALLSFNAGVELGQLAVLAVIVPALALLFRYMPAERTGAIIVSAFVAHTGWHWMLDRYQILRQFPWPEFTAADAAAAIRWLMLLIGLGSAAYGLSRIRSRSSESMNANAGGPGAQV